VRLVLLESYYRTGAPNQPLRGGQKRFHTASPEEFWRQMDRLMALEVPPSQTFGVAPHSFRAAAPDEVVELVDEARRRGLVVHLHVEEQRREIEECVAAWGARPMQLPLDRLHD
jgi:cytosine/adenosine deaminase-related metal-dependent hydrolase